VSAVMKLRLGNVDKVKINILFLRKAVKSVLYTKFGVNFLVPMHKGIRDNLLNKPFRMS